jgi:hypothetical protein
MNIVLWSLQVLLALLCIAGGSFQLFKLNELQQGVAAMRELPHGLWALFGAINCLGGLGLLVPASWSKLPALTALAATVVAVESALLSALYVYYGDRPPLSYSISMAVLAAFIAYGRFVLKPV